MHHFAGVGFLFVVAVVVLVVAMLASSASSGCDHD